MNKAAMSMMLAALDALNRHVDVLPVARLMSQPIVSLVDAQRQAAGNRLVSLELPGWFAAILAQAVVLFYFWRSGGAARWRDRLRSVLASETAVRFVFGATLVLLARASAIIPFFYLWRVERVMGLSHALTRVWGYEYLIETILGMIVAGCIVAVVLGLVERTHQWYLYTIGGILAISLLGTLLDPYAIAPIFERYVPLQGPVAATARSFTASQGYARIPIVVEHRVDRIPVDPAKTQGMGATQQLVVADTLVGVATPGELDFYLADMLAQLDGHDPLNLALVDAATVIIGAALAVVVADRIRFRRDDDPVARITLVGALLALAYIPAVVVDHAAATSMELRASRVAVAMTGDRASAMRALVRAGDERVEPVCPSAARALLYRSPSLGQEAAAIGGRDGCP